MPRSESLTVLSVGFTRVYVCVHIYILGFSRLFCLSFALEFPSALAGKYLCQQQHLRSSVSWYILWVAPF